MAIHSLRTQNLVRPIGFRINTPRFSWTIESPKAKWIQWSRVTVSLEPDLSSPLFDSGQDHLLPSNGYEVPLDLTPHTRYYWQVEAALSEDDGQGSGWTESSAVEYFETGKMDEPWTGEWITAPLDADRHPYFHRNFEVKPGLLQATVTVTALGLYELELNGRKVGHDYLTPFYNDYRHWIQTQTYDITDSLSAGPNAAGVLLGNGWYKGRFGFVEGMDKLYGERTALLLDMRFLYEDGSEERIGSDSSWLCLPSPILESSIYDGEVYDARLEIPKRSTTDCFLGDARPAEPYDHGMDTVAERLSPPLTLHATLTPTLIHTPAGETVLDFGQIMTGWVEFDADVSRDREVALSYGEILQHGNFYRDNLRDAKAMYRYISDGTPRTVRPHFTFFGFRYVKVEGLDQVRPEDFRAQVLHSDLAFTGTIETSDPAVNRLIRNALWSQRGNFVDVPTDCPQRDERMGWTGDAQVFAATASFNMYTPAFYHKYLHDMRLLQERLDGAVPHVIPDALSVINERLENPVHTNYASCAWADAATVIPWTLYLFYGDKAALAEHYPNMRMWVEYIRRQDREQGDKRLWLGGTHYADWLALDNPDKSSSFGGTDHDYVASAYYLYSSTLIAKAARALELDEDARTYEQLAGEVREALRQTYFDAGGHCTECTQTAQVLALYFRFAPEGGENTVLQDLLDLLDANGGYLTTGFVGTAYLCLTLSAYGRHDYAWRLLLNDGYPSWLYEVGMGATTIWERWNSVLPDGLLSDTGMNSLNHYAYGAIVEWIYRIACGINPTEDKPGFRHARIVPIPDPTRRLVFARAGYDSASGRYESGWRYDGDSVVYEVTVPLGATATFTAWSDGSYILNGAAMDHEGESFEQKLGPGRYEIRCKAPQRTGQL